jgi:hypothetical protein
MDNMDECPDETKIKIADDDVDRARGRAEKAKPMGFRNVASLCSVDLVPCF